MSYLVVDSFSIGVDRRRPVYTGTTGALWEAINCHLSRGGDIEKRKAFVHRATLPENTFGLAEWGGSLGVFGSDVAPPVPSGFTYQRLQHPTGKSMTDVLDWDLFNGLPYVVAKFADDTIHHFYNGTRISYWDGITARPTAVMTNKNKMHAVGGSILHFSDASDPTSWTPGAPSLAGNINLANQYSGAESLVGMAPYQQQVAILAQRNIQLWNLDADPDNSAVLQVLNDTGALSSHSILSYGDLDVFYLAANGIRSIRSRDQVNIAGVSDVGTPIDPLIVEWVKAQSAETVAKACSVMDPETGRFWMCIGSRIFVFSYFPTSKISAWTWYEPGFSISDFVVKSGIIYCRSGDVIYAYGGTTGTQYDSCPVSVKMPFVSGKRPGTRKSFTGIDIASNGVWYVELLMNPRVLAERVVIGSLDGFTINSDHVGVVGHSTHVAPVFTNQAAGPASMSQVLIYFLEGEDE